ncbi:hypothetical protein BC629DRAFT_1446705 [Irpex lacteus]|nr:hypothetical protein BC629DRAFT_1446705 [Irpex lacteus]
MPPGLPQVEELSSSGSGTGSFATIYDVGSVDTIDSYRSSIQEVIPGAMPPRPISPLSPAIPWPNERVVTPDRPISPIPSASNRGPLPSDYTPAAHMRYPSATQDDDLSMPIPTTRRLLETPLLAIMAEIDCPRVFPIVPPNLPRYSRPINIPKRDMNKPYVKSPGKMKFDSGSVWMESIGWTRCIHPEGARYYYDPERRIYTEANLDEGIQMVATIEKCIAFIDTTYKDIIPDPQQCDLVLEYDPHRPDLCHYYFAHHHTRSIFWLEEYDLQPELKRVQGEITPSHLDIAVERLYCLLKQLFVKYFGDGPADPIYVLGLISIVDHIKESDDPVYALAIAGRLYNRFLSSHFLNYHGEVGARLDSNQSVHGSPAPRVNGLMKILFVLLFNNPKRYLQNIHDIHTDGVVKEATWRKHMADFMNSWREYILYATVLLNANVALLATPTITPQSTSSSNVGEVASFLSIITSTGCIVVGLLLVRQHQIGPQRAAAEVLQQFLNRAGSAQRLAILYSVPYALLIWR